MKWTTEILDVILGLQFRVAWAGEALSDPPRLRWWPTDLVDPMSGGDFLQRLARLTDLKSRKLVADPDSARTLFSWGFELDEMLADRIREQKWALAPAPAMGEFDRTRLEEEFKALAPEASYNIQASGRQMRGPLPEDPAQAARLLVAALTPLGDAYPTPFFRISTT